MLTVDRMAEGGFSGASRWFRCAAGIRGEYIVRWRSVLSLTLSRLEDSLMLPRMSWMGIERKGDAQTKKAKISGVYHGNRIGIPRHVIEGGQTSPDVGNTKNASMDRVEHFVLCVDLILDAGSRRTCGSVGSRRGPGASQHGDSEDGLEEGK